MVINILANGDVKNIIPENIYQGSNKANTIYVLAPFSANVTALISFEIITTGKVLEAVTMDSPTEISNELNLWKIDISQVLTQYYGDVKYQILFKTNQETITVAKGLFRVKEGVDFELPESPTSDVYELILENLSTIKANFLNGWIEAQGLKVYNSEFSYSQNSFIIAEVDGVTDVYKSKIENNKGNEVTNSEVWEKVTIGTSPSEILRNARTYTDSQINKIVDGNLISKKAEQDKNGNVIDEYYSSNERVDDVEKNVADILSGDLVVNRATNDKDGNEIDSTYFKKENIVSGWSITPSDDKVPSEKLVKKTLNSLVAGESTKDIVFDTFQDFENWLNGEYERDDGFTLSDLKIGTGVLFKEQGVSDYWCSDLTTPITVDNFSPFEVAIDLENYLTKNNTIEFTPKSDYNPVHKKYVDDALKKKMPFVHTTTGEYVYGRSSATEKEYKLLENAQGYSVPKRTQYGQLLTTSPTADSHAVNKKYLENELEKIDTSEAYFIGTPSSLTTTYYIYRNNIPSKGEDFTTILSDSNSWFSRELKVGDIVNILMIKSVADKGFMYQTVCKVKEIGEGDEVTWTVLNHPYIVLGKEIIATELTDSTQISDTKVPSMNLFYSILQGLTSDFVNTSDEQAIKGLKTFGDEVHFNAPVEHNDKIKINNSTLEISKDDGDSVATLSADSLTREIGNLQIINSLPTKNGEFAVVEEDIEITPSSAINGILSDENFNKLMNSTTTRIILNNEYYEIADNNHVKGIRTYTHLGWGGEKIMSKSINITTSTKSWVLVESSQPTYSLDGTTLTITL